jgi:hypothetical protein
LTGSTLLTTAFATVVLAIKTLSVLRLSRLPVPRVLSGCAVLDAQAAAAAVSPAAAST